MSDDSDDEDEEDSVSSVAHRFVRSVVRVFVCFSGDLQPSALANDKQAKYLERFTKVFKELMDVSIEELCLNADALMAPVRLGAVRPVAPFSFSSKAEDALVNTDELFRVGPYAPKKQKASESSSRQGRRVDSATFSPRRNRTSSHRNRHNSSTPLSGTRGVSSGQSGNGNGNQSTGWGFPLLARRQGSIRTAELGRTPIIIDANGDQLIGGDEQLDPPAIEEINADEIADIPNLDLPVDEDDEEQAVQEVFPDALSREGMEADEADLANLIDDPAMEVNDPPDPIADELIAEEEHAMDDEVEEEDEEEDEEEEDETLDGQSHSDESNHSDEYHEENTYEIHDDPEFLAYTSIDEPFLSSVRRERGNRESQFAMNWAVRNHRPNREHRRYRQWLRFYK